MNKDNPNASVYCHSAGTSSNVSYEIIRSAIPALVLNGTPRVQIMFTESGEPNAVMIDKYEFYPNDDTMDHLFISFGKFPDIRFLSLREIIREATDIYPDIKKEVSTEEWNEERQRLSLYHRV